MEGMNETASVFQNLFTSKLLLKPHCGLQANISSSCNCMKDQLEQNSMINSLGIFLSFSWFT